EADHDVEADGKQDEVGDLEQYAAPVVSRRDDHHPEHRHVTDVRQQVGHGREDQHEQGPDRPGQPAEPAAHGPPVGLRGGRRWGVFLYRAHARALPRDSPSSPVGRNMRTPTSTMNTMTRRNSVPKTSEA